MDLLETYQKKKDNHSVDDENKHLLNEVSVAASVGSFTGRGGQLVDQLFAGAFHPEFGQLKDLLKKQIDSNIIKRMYTDDNTPPMEQDFVDLEYDYPFDELPQMIDKSKFKNTSETEMQQVELNIDYEKIDKEKTRLQIHLNVDDKDKWKSNVKYVYDDDTLFKLKKLKFKNTSEDKMQYVDIEIPYDKIFDKAEENKKFINDKNNWSSVYDLKKEGD